MKVVELQSLRNSQQSKILWEAAAKVFQLPKWGTTKKVYNGLIPISALYEGQEFGEYEPDVILKYNAQGKLNTLTISTATSGREVIYYVDHYGIDIAEINFGKDGSTAAAGSILFHLQETAVKMFPGDAWGTSKEYANNYLDRSGLVIANDEKYAIRFSDYTGPIGRNDYDLHQQYETAI
jgi:hypothetical protein